MDTSQVAASDRAEAVTAALTAGCVPSRILHQDPAGEVRATMHLWTIGPCKLVTAQATSLRQTRTPRHLRGDDQPEMLALAMQSHGPAQYDKGGHQQIVRTGDLMINDLTSPYEVTCDLLKRPDVARQTMRDDTARFLVNRAQFDNSAQVRETIRERTPAVRKIEHTIEYLDLVGSCHQFVATLGRLVPRMRGQEFTDDERETVRRGISKVRAAADWLEAAIDNGEFTLDEQLAKLLKGE
ncbi:MAG TPA: DUF6192 family protein [Streptomyces sp.]